jgi:GGDEF-like domain
MRASVVEQLRTHVSEIERAIYARISKVPGAADGADDDYQEGLVATVAAVVEYSLNAIEAGDGMSGPIPEAAVAQARRAARAGVSQGTVLRRYLAGHRQFVEFLVEVAEKIGYAGHGPLLQDLRIRHGALIEHVTASVEHEYNLECERVSSTPEQRRAEIVKSLLAGESVPSTDLAELDYEIHTSWHIGLVATGIGAEEPLRKLKAHFGRRLLLVSVGGSTWAWLGGQKKPSAADIEHLTVTGVGFSLGVGEPGKGLEGWRLTHDQSRAALEVALRRPERFARYSDVRLLAAALQNDTLARSLRQRYLEPLSSQKDGGESLRQTLRAYINVECNATSAAPTVQVGRRAVKRRVRTAERLIGSAVCDCLSELDIALQLEELVLAATSDEVYTAPGA